LVKKTRGLCRRDNFKGRSVADSVRLLEQGIASFAQWGLPRPTAFRSGNLQHDDNLYQALARVGIPYSSNVAVAIYNSGDAELSLDAGPHTRETRLKAWIDHQRTGAPRERTRRVQRPMRRSRWAPTVPR
jgi:hypothetical protein